MNNVVIDYAKEFRNIWRLKFSHNTRQERPSNRTKKKVRTARHASPWAKGQRANTFVITDVDLTGRTTGRPYKRVLWISGTVSADRPRVIRPANRRTYPRSECPAFEVSDSPSVSSDKVFHFPYLPVLWE
ncbi:hypothetical protein V1478_011879 [Vespula squamosa]|uniref:Uncharacterized protein n=1 Tax=Vespula squamosa TaxID=30214 RepID=A0ABD2ABL9_VESSQ